MTDKEIKKFIVFRNNWIKGKLRQMSIRWSESSQALKDARKSRGLYECKMCSGLFKANQVHKDHVDPIIPVTGAVKQPNGELDWNVWISRCFVKKEGIQILCESCHHSKTEIEDTMRAHYNGKRKEEKFQEKLKNSKQKKKEE